MVWQGIKTDVVICCYDDHFLVSFSGSCFTLVGLDVVCVVSSDVMEYLSGYCNSNRSYGNYTASQVCINSYLSWSCYKS